MNTDHDNAQSRPGAGGRANVAMQMGTGCVARPPIARRLVQLAVLRDSLLDTDAVVDETRRDVEEAAARLQGGVCRRDDLQRQLENAITDAKRGRA